MIFSKGNKKLGNNCLVTSRAVGDTCPSTCDYLHSGCYAEHIEKFRPHTRNIGLQNIITDYNKIRSMLLYAVKNNKDVRLHERGDWYKDGKLDKDYLSNFIKAIKSVDKLPSVWFYTHIYSKQLSDLSKYGIHVYASVHSVKDMEQACKKGFKLFAWNDTHYKYTKRRDKNAPKYVTIGRKKFLVCPEQRLSKNITCTGGKSIACNYCVKGKGNVLFIDH